MLLFGGNSFQTNFCFHRDPDSVSFCLLATDDFECDIALQIHFTLIQAFCFDNDISIVRVNDLKRLNALVGAKGQLEDAHCVLITVRICSYLTFKCKSKLIYPKTWFLKPLFSVLTEPS